MPSPIGHLLGGAAVYLAATHSQNRSRVTLGMTMIGSILPDFDFLPGILIGEPAAFHHGVSHSLGFAGLFGALVFITLHLCRPKNGAGQAALLASFAYGLHVVLDFVSAKNSVPLAWPLFVEKIGVNLNLFGHFHHGGFEGGIWSIVRWANLAPVMRELTILGIPVLLLVVWRERRRWSNFVRYRGNQNEYEH
jgi:hypothetical protein